MRTVRTKVYKFNELTEDAKKVAIDSLFDINVSHGWWECTYMDAENIGLKITSFDLERNRHAKGEFIQTAIYCANKIMTEHGETCETYKTAANFIAAIQEIEQRAEIEGKEGDEDYWFQDEIEELEEEFLKSLCEDYSLILENEFEYLMTSEAIAETIEANDYEFLVTGKQF